MVKIWKRVGAGEIINIITARGENPAHGAVAIQHIHAVCMVFRLGGALEIVCHEGQLAVVLRDGRCSVLRAAEPVGTLANLSRDAKRRRRLVKDAGTKENGGRYISLLHKEAVMPAVLSIPEHIAAVIVDDGHFARVLTIHLRGEPNLSQVPQTRGFASPLPGLAQRR